MKTPLTNEEIEFYKPYLLEIIRLVDPVIMLLTGNVATQALLGMTGITKLRGQWFNYQGDWTYESRDSILYGNDLQTI